MDNIQIFSGYVDRKWIFLIEKNIQILSKYYPLKYPENIQNIQILSMDTHLRIHGYVIPRICVSMDNIRIFFGYKVDTYWICIYGYSMDTFWKYFGYKEDTYWIHFGYISMDISLIHFGNNVDTIWIYIGYIVDIYPWIFLGDTLEIMRA